MGPIRDAMVTIGPLRDFGSSKRTAYASGKKVVHNARKHTQNYNMEPQFQLQPHKETSAYLDFNVSIDQNGPRWDRMKRVVWTIKFLAIGPAGIGFANSDSSGPNVGRQLVMIATPSCNEDHSQPDNAGNTDPTLRQDDVNKSRIPAKREDIRDSREAYQNAPMNIALNPEDLARDIRSKQAHSSMSMRNSEVNTIKDTEATKFSFALLLKSSLLENRALSLVASQYNLTTTVYDATFEFGSGMDFGHNPVSIIPPYEFVSKS
ncbi:hypothetical protein FHL15_008742 [Xylaria flabelliformis]|uniref:Uncharacterized protein n=1 Tax=Xylaria flabelliformis TaxID=2512241 RepID=A0A553HQZ4_9PEZI|nr:hypothetical protein FHL15_008742 [Xylaria flabelliformis]